MQTPSSQGTAVLDLCLVTGGTSRYPTGLHMTFPLPPTHPIPCIGEHPPTPWLNVPAGAGRGMGVKAAMVAIMSSRRPNVPLLPTKDCTCIHRLHVLEPFVDGVCDAYGILPLAWHIHTWNLH